MNIIIYTTAACAYCAMVKKFLDSKKLSYKVVNLDENPAKRQELLERTGAMTVPITEVQTPQKLDDGYLVDYIVGWQPAKLMQLVKA